MRCYCGAEACRERAVCDECGRDLRGHRIAMSLSCPETGASVHLQYRDAVWTLLFGPIFLGGKGMWKYSSVMFFMFSSFVASTHFNFGFPIVAITYFVVNWIYFPMMTMRLMRRHYLRKGYLPG